MRRTKIVCTMGPNTNSKDMMKKLVENGMDVARFNFSHGDHEEQKMRMDLLKEVRRELKVPVAILLDTKGPEIRTGELKDHQKVTLKENQTFVLTSEQVIGDESRVSITYEGLGKDVTVGGTILIDDGLIEMKVVNIDGKDVICQVLNSGPVSNHKSINVPDVELSMDYVSQKDIDDIIFGIENDFDFIAASFVRTAYDVLDIKRILENNGGENIQIIAKIENRQGVDNIESILKVSDSIMVARGDMGVEISFDELPAIQKRIIKRCYTEGKKVITATQMLESITHNPRPTRAEISDVANAVYDGTSAVMLSGETAVGDYPVLALETMARICVKTEENIDYVKRFENTHLRANRSVSNAISHSSCATAHDIEAAAIVTVSRSGYTPRQISGFRPVCPIIACVMNEKTWRQLNLSWGVLPLMSEAKKTSDELFEQAVDLAVNKTDIVNMGDVIVLTGGAPLGVSGTTNLLKVQLVGDVLLQGSSIGSKIISGKVCVAKNKAEAVRNFEDGDILVIPETSNELISLLKRASAIITEAPGFTSHAAIVGMTLGIPVLCGAKNATNVLKNQSIITIDGNRGQVYAGIAKIV